MSTAPEESGDVRVGGQQHHEQHHDRQHHEDQPPAEPGPAGDGPDPQVAELEDRWRRALAEAENQRKRFERLLADRVRDERARVTAAFLPVLDHLELALRHAEADPESIVAGVRAVRDQAVAVLAGLGYRRVDETGVRFDPARHEAAEVDAETRAEPGSVVAVLRPGYAGEGGELLRPATVAVAADAGRSDATGDGE